jgi:hypothetical protein
MSATLLVQRDRTESYVSYANRDVKLRLAIPKAQPADAAENANATYS